MSNKPCVICGEPGYMYYPFCKHHLKEKNEGKIVKCEECGIWHYHDAACSCSSNNNICIVCGKESDDVFCTECNEIVNSLPQNAYENIEGAEKHFENMLIKIKVEAEEHYNTNFNFIEALCRLYLIAQRANEQFDDKKLVDEYFGIIDELRKNILDTCQDTEEEESEDDKTEHIQTVQKGDDKGSQEGDGTCIICGENSRKHKLCSDCWKTKESDDLGFSQKRSKDEIREHYFSHKSYLYKLSNAKFLYYGMIRLYKIAEELYISYHDMYLINLVKDDLKNLNERLASKIDNNSSIKNFDSDTEFTESDEKDFRKIYPAEISCKDGHYVRSTFEKILDDWLYDNKIFHCYEKRKYFGEAANQCVISDFYLPENDLYIELWGNIDKKYAKRKAAKIEIYKNEKLNLLQVEDYECKEIDSTMDRNVIKYGIKLHK